MNPDLTPNLLVPSWGMRAQVLHVVRSASDGHFAAGVGVGRPSKHAAYFAARRARCAVTSGANNALSSATFM